MASSRIRHLALTLLLAMPAVPHAQQEARPVLAFDCWISSEDAYAPIHYIACIEDRGDAPAADDALDSPETVVLDTIHRLLHSGTGSELAQYVGANAATLRNGEIRKIRIFTYPSAWSWDDERPQLLVRLLCPDGYDCPVFFRRGEHPPPAQ